MVFKKGGDAFKGGEVSLGTDAWNVADGFTQLKILRLLILLDRYDTIAQFGTEDIGEGAELNDNQISQRRVEGLQRLQSITRQLLGNTLFAIKKADKPTIEAMLGRLKTLDEFIPKSFSQKHDHVSQEDYFEIDEQLFSKILEILTDIKVNLNIPLNNAGLIFRPSEEIDLDKIMNDIVEGG